MNNKVLCYFEDIAEKTYLRIDIFEVKKSLFKTSVNYENVLSLNFFYELNENSSIDSVISFGKSIIDALNERNIKFTSIDYIIKSKSFFNSVITLPKLSGKKLENASNEEIKKRYNKMINDYVIMQTNRPNNKGGIDVGLLLFKEVEFQTIIGIFALNKINIEKIYYFPSLFACIAPDLDNKTRAFIFTDDKFTRYGLIRNGVVIDYYVVPFGSDDFYEFIEKKLKSDEIVSQDFLHDHADDPKVVKLVKENSRKDFDVILNLMMKHQLNDLEEIFINNQTGYSEEMLEYIPDEFKPITKTFSEDENIEKYYYLNFMVNSKKTGFLLPKKVKVYGRKQN